MKTLTVWKNDMAFSSEFEGHTIDMNGQNGPDGKRLGFGPKALLLSGLAGCSGIDVVEILNKMKVPFTKLEISTEAHVAHDHPKVFTEVTITYTTDAAAEHFDKVQRAVGLSLDKYCGVSAMLKKNSPVISKIVLV